MSSASEQHVWPSVPHRAKPSSISYFQDGREIKALALPQDYLSVIEQWASLRSKMVRDMHPAFRRSEWAYLMTFLEPCRLKKVFSQCFGEPVEAGVPDQLWTPRPTTGVWLPNNVSLLGPLTLVLLSLIGAPCGFKAGSRTQNLVSALLDYARDRLDEGALRSFLFERVQVSQAPRDSEEAKSLARWAHSRLIFASDEAAAAINALEHPLESQSIAFVDKQSEIWLEHADVSDETLREIVAVFAVYGRLGCTSPRQIVLLEGGTQHASGLAKRLAALWSEVEKGPAELHIASETLLSMQWAKALGHEAIRTPGGHATLSVGPAGKEQAGGRRILHIHAQPLEERLAQLPDNLQTIGHSFGPELINAILPSLAASPALRLVPIAQMHHFSTLWDGHEFWRRLFRVTEIRQ